MSSKQTKKRKVGDENRSFNEKWKLDYFFTLVKDKAVCLLCSDSVSVLKEYNIKRHYETKHETNYKNIQGQIRKDKLNQLEKSLKQQQNIFKAQTFSSDLAVKASYTVSQILAKKMKPFADGEMIKECLTAVAEIAFPDKKDIIAKISLSRFTIGRRIEDLSVNITETLGKRIGKFQWCSLALDESCDITDTSQLAIFVRGIDSNFNITEELGSLMPMAGTTTGEDLYNELKSLLEKLSIPLEKIVGISTDGARAMASMNVGVAGRLFNDIKNLTGREIFVNHCIIHQQNLCAKTLNMPNVTTPVIKLINFLKSHALNHRQFKEFLKDLQSDYGDVIYNTEVRWLSRGAMLKRIYNLKNYIQMFVEMKEYPFPQFNDKEWMCDFAFLVDITQHLNDLNMELQGKSQLIHNMFDKIKAFERKLTIWNKHLLSNNTSHFPYLRKETPSETRKYAKQIQKLITEFESRFKIFRSEKTVLSFNIFSSPFNLDVETVPDELQMELIDLQNNTDLRNKFQNVDIQQFYQNYMIYEKFPRLVTHAMQMMTLFGSTYVCEQLFSAMQIIKCDNRSRLNDVRLESCVRVAVSSISANIDQLTAKMQCQNSH